MPTTPIVARGARTGPIVARGTAIAVVAPCGIFDPARLDAGLAIVRDRGHDVRPLPDLLRPWRFLAGDDDHRVAQLLEALTSPAYGAVWIARGGYGLTRILDRIPFGELPPRPVIGFSDVTVLLAALDAAGRGPAIHGPMIHSLPATDARSIDQLFALLDGQTEVSLPGAMWVDGEAEGRLVGGNLCLFAATCGTSRQVDARGAILVLEEIAEAPYRVDRMLVQLTQAGVFEGVRAVALGEFTGCEPPAGAAYALRDVLLDHLAALGVPVIADLPIGHGSRNHAFVWGAAARVRDGALSFDASRSFGVSPAPASR